ncbi:MAG: M20/M25/M40 family metallo-hydrolase [Candidatus Marinamargulisbacteria bacterium]
MSTELLMNLLSIPSPTYGEGPKADFCSQWLHTELPQAEQQRFGNNIIATMGNPSQTTVAFVGHLDTVPEYFEPRMDDQHIYGSGASDMQAGVACYLNFIKTHTAALLNRYRVMIILYDKEEGTPLHENGLHECIQQAGDLISSIDVAIVAEPTNNALQLGCVGSIHTTVTIPGKAAHSARPWHGENAVYNALPFIQTMANMQPVRQTIHGVDFFDVMSITETQCSPGRTTVPDWWRANINYRFSPIHTLDAARTHVQATIQAACPTAIIEELNAVPAGDVIDHPVLQSAKQLLPVEAKQAWTDVAQLTGQGICAFNFGPGRQDQAHQPNECVNVADMVQYETYLQQLLLED